MAESENDCRSTAASGKTSTQKVTVRHIVDLWAETPEGEQLVASFNDRVSMPGISRRLKEARENVRSGLETYEDCLQQVLLPNYFMFDS